MSLSDVLKGLINESLEGEKYGGVSIAQVLPMVDLECGFGMDEQGRRTTLPVVEIDCSSCYEHSVPNVSLVEMNGERYMIRAKNDFKFLDEESVKIMRARFLLIRDAYYPQIRSMGYAMRGEVVVKFFGGAVWMPPEGSDLSKAIGLEGLLPTTDDITE